MILLCVSNHGLCYLWAFFTGKKGKKSKWQPVPLQTLIPQSAGGFPAMPKMTSSWADEPDDDHGESFFTLI